MKEKGTQKSGKAGSKTDLHGEGNGNPLQYYCLENPMDRGARLQSMGSKRVGHDFTFTFKERKRTKNSKIKKY